MGVFEGRNRTNVLEKHGRRWRKVIVRARRSEKFGKSPSSSDNWHENPRPWAATRPSFAIIDLTRRLKI